MSITNYVMPPTSHEVTIYNQAFLQDVHMRLGAAGVCRPGALCQHIVEPTGAPCNRALDTWGIHSLRCTRCAGRRTTPHDKTGRSVEYNLKTWKVRCQPGRSLKGLSKKDPNFFICPDSIIDWPGSQMRGVIDYFIHNPLDTGDTHASRHMQHMVTDEDKAGREAWHVKQHGWPR